MFNLGQQQPLNKSNLADNQTNQFQNQTNFQTNQNQAFNPQSNFNQFPNQLNNQLTPNKGFFQIPEKFLQLVPMIPFALEMLTGQKIPPIGAMADILSGVQQLQFGLQQVITNQNQLWNQLKSLENNASSQLTNLSQQLTNTKQDFRVFATETKKSLEFQGNGKDLEQARKFIPRTEPESNYNEPESEYN